jgi:hypothetical protein
MRRLRPALVAITVAITLASALSGCTFLSTIPGLVPDPPASGNIGSCLDGLNGADSDRYSVVDCDQPHLFQVTAVDQWPGMADAIEAADGDLGAVWDDIHLAGGTADSAEYGMWASRDCNEAAQRTVGIDDVVVDGHTAADLWLRIGGTYNVDLSLNSREKFVGENDVSTFCSLAWYDESGKPRLVDAPPFEQLVHPGFAPDMRECWSGNYSTISCDEPHAGQVLLAFDGLEAFGPELIDRAATGQPLEADWTTADDFCEQLLLQTIPSSANLADLGYLADIQVGYGWDEYDGAVDPDAVYFFACLAVAPETGDMLTGDVFEGTAAVDGSGSTA